MRYAASAQLMSAGQSFWQANTHWLLLALSTFSPDGAEVVFIRMNCQAKCAVQHNSQDHDLYMLLVTCLQVLSGADVLHKDAVASDVHQALVALAGSIASNWRCQQHLAAAIPALPGLLGQEVLCEHWAPYSFDLLLTGELRSCSLAAGYDKLTCRRALLQARVSAYTIGCRAVHSFSTVVAAAAGAACVKPAAASSLAHLLHSCRRERPRTELYCRIIRELAWGRSCWARLAYTQVGASCSLLAVGPAAFTIVCTVKDRRGMLYVSGMVHVKQYATPACSTAAASRGAHLLAKRLSCSACVALSAVVYYSTAAPQLVVAALPLFSCRWVKEHLLEGVLGLLGDGVPNVRLAALGLLPALKQTIRLPEDVERLVRRRLAG